MVAFNTVEAAMEQVIKERAKAATPLPPCKKLATRQPLPESPLK